MLADVFHWRQILSAARRIMRVHRYVGKKAMIVYLLLAVENGARRLCRSSTLYKGGIGQQRQPLKECVAKRKRCAASELEQTP